MPIYSPTGFLDITNATLRTSNLEAQNFKLNGGNIYVTSELTTDELLNLDNVVNAGNATSNTVQFTNLTTGLVADSNIVVTGNVTAGSFLGDGSGLTSIPPSAITGTLSQWSDGTNGDVYIASNVGIGNVHTLTSNTLQVGANLYVRDADANVLTVTGNVAADYFEGDGSKLTGISSTLQAITDSGNVTSNTVQFTNATTGFVTTSNIEVGGALKINTITAAAYHSLQAVTNVGNVTSNTVQFSNATTGLVTTGNVEVGRDLSVTGNLTVLGTRTIVDTDTLRVKDPIIELGKDNPGTGDLGLVMTRPSGSSNVAVVFDESTDTLEIGYTQSNASDTDITMRTAATEPLDVNVNGNVSVGKELTVSGNVEVGTANLFVDTVNSRVGVGTTNPDYSFDVQTTSDASDKTMTRLYSAANATGVSSTGLILEKGPGYGGVIKGFISQGIGSGLSLHTLNGGTEAQAMTIMNSGNVGVGTTSPGNMLHIYKGGAEATSGLFIEKASGGVGTAAALLFGTNAVGENEGIAKAGIFFQRTATNGRGDFQFCLDNVDNATPIGLSNSKMTIKSDGNVGIGNTTPTQILDVGSSLSNPFICRHLSGSLHDADKRDSVSFGRIDGSDFLGMKCRVDTHTALGYGDYANQTKIGFFTWGSNYDNSREVMSILGNGCLKYQKQPRFSAYSTSGNATYSGTSGGPVVLDSTFYNVGSHYSTSTGAFTAPVAGHYRFSMTVFNNSTSSVQVSMWYRTSNSGTWDDIVPYILLGGSASGDETIFTSSTSEGNSWTIDLYVPANYQIGFGGRGGAPLTIYRAHSYFSGELISIA